MLKLIVLKVIYIIPSLKVVVEGYVNFSICIVIFIPLQRESREASKLVDVAQKLQKEYDKVNI